MQRKTSKFFMAITVVTLIAVTVFAQSVPADRSAYLASQIRIEVVPEQIAEAHYLKNIIDNNMAQRAPWVLEQLVERGVIFKIISWTPAYRDFNVLVDFSRPNEMIFIDRYLREARVDRKYTNNHIMRTIGHELLHLIQNEAGMYSRLRNITGEELFEFMQDASALGISYNEPVYSDATLRQIFSDMLRRAGDSSACEIAYVFLELDADAKGRIFIEPRKYRTISKRNTELLERYNALVNQNRFNDYLEWARNGTCMGR